MREMLKLDRLQRLDWLGLEPEPHALGGVPYRLDREAPTLAWPEALASAAEAAAGRALWQLEPPGDVDRRRALGARWELSHDWISLADGPDDALARVLAAWAWGGPVLVTAPGEPGVLRACRVLGLPAVAVRLEADFALPMEQFARVAAKAGAKAIVAGSPSDPTGRATSRAEWLALAEATDALVVVDERHLLEHELSLADAVPQAENLVVVRSLAHEAGRPDWKLAYVVSHPRVSHELRKAGPHPAWGALAHALAEPASEAALALAPARAELAKRREALRASLAGLDGVVSWPSAAPFLLLATTRPGAALASDLRREGVACRSFAAAPLGPCLRVTIAEPEALAAFERAMRLQFPAAPGPARPDGF